MTMRLFLTAALVGCGAFHVAFAQNTCETFTDMEHFTNSGMATGPTSTLVIFTASGTMTFTNTYATSNQGNGLGPCANGNPAQFTETATGQSNSKGFCNPTIAYLNDPISGMYQNAQMQVANATINSNGVCTTGKLSFPKMPQYECTCPPASCSGCTNCEKCVNDRCVPLCTGNCATCVGGVCELNSEACSGCAYCSGGSNNFNCEADEEDCGDCGTCAVTGTAGTCSGLGDEACTGCLACKPVGGKYNCQPDDGYCGSGEKCCVGGDCEVGGCTVCPIVLDAFNEGYHLTSLAGGVRFTVLPGGPLQQMSWTDANWRNGWLALDRNGDGTIDDFTELFGNYTAQPSSTTPNGFLALAVFDNPGNGGNGNGFIDPGDAVYSHLRVWIDSNHNGVSEPNELHTLQELGVFKIGLEYHSTPFVDQYGNQFRFKGSFWDESDSEKDLCYDVFLQIRGQ